MGEDSRGKVTVTFPQELYKAGIYDLLLQNYCMHSIFLRNFVTNKLDYLTIPYHD